VIVPVGIKQYGSQASFLAVDSSDVDLAVTGLKIGGDKGSQLREMRRLFTELFSLKPQGYISHIEIIESASVPLIKL
jgi:DNA polymerase sigma